ncbi:MAG: bifunctional folylpolyglutamate synthase/dihydrofolate synthase [Clostridia bacterium]|nr:bifunctional folylpolyglutamate synthase/dihydrofolate synthase [Clostridia bacterium]
MNYEEALEYIHSINWEFCKPGLERIAQLCNGLENPQKSLKFIHVAGTNGKGSFCSMLSSVLCEAGYRVGLYTSPYIETFNERMAINGESISNSELVSVTERVKLVADKMKDKPTEFELVTAIALEYFSQNKCDYVVLECGLGGRLDSTNIIDTPVLSVITGISLDHTSILGDSVEKIAGEKAGIIKNNVPCLWCGEDKDAYEVIKTLAEKRNAPFFTIDHSKIKIIKTSLEGTSFDFEGYNNVEIKLLGTYQPVNASNVLKAIEILKSQGLNIPIDSIYNGFLKARWKARFERILATPPVIFDGAHNPEGVFSAVDSIERYFPQKGMYIITGVMKDKDYRLIAKKISTVAEKVFTITPDNPRALDAKEYADVYSGLGVEAQGFDSIKEALESCITEARENKRAVACLGSLYMYKELVLELRKMNF